MKPDHEELAATAGFDARLQDMRAPLIAVNTELLRQLLTLARRPGESKVDFIDEQRAGLIAIASCIDDIAARAPVLLVDMRFRESSWWKAVAADSSRARVEPALPPLLSRACALKLSGATIALAWHLSRTDRGSCLVLLGLAPAVADIVRELSPQQLAKIAEQHWAHLRPRWEEYPAFWRDLLRVPTRRDEARALALRTLQLTCAAGLPRA